MSTRRKYRRLVERGGIECFTVRFVQWIDEDGELITSTDISCPDADDEAAMHEVLGTIELGKAAILASFEHEPDDE